MGINWGPVSEWVLAGLLVADSVVFYLVDKSHHIRKEEENNLRGYCPDCGNNLGTFYSNRIEWEEKGGKAGS